MVSIFGVRTREQWKLFPIVLFGISTHACSVATGPNPSPGATDSNKDSITLGSNSSSGDAAGTTSGDAASTTTGDAASTTTGDAASTTTGDAASTTTGDAASTTSGDTAGTTSGDTAGTTSGDTAGTTSGDTAGTTSGDGGGASSGDASTETIPETMGDTTAEADTPISLSCDKGNTLTAIHVKSDGNGIQDFGISCKSTSLSGMSLYKRKWAIGASVTFPETLSIYTYTGGFIQLSYRKNSDGRIYQFPTSSGYTGTLPIGQTSSDIFEVGPPESYHVTLSCSNTTKFTGFTASFNDSGDLYQLRPLSRGSTCSYSWNNVLSGISGIDVPDDPTDSGGGYCPGVIVPDDGIRLPGQDDDLTCDDGGVADAGQLEAETFSGP